MTKLDAAARCRLGIGRTYQVPRPFGDMTVFENLLVAAQQGGGLRRRASYAAAVGALDRCGVTGQANLPAERLGLLQRKRLELARGPRHAAHRCCCWTRWRAASPTPRWPSWSRSSAA